MTIRWLFLTCMLMGAIAGILYAGNSVIEAASANNEAETAQREVLAIQSIFRIPEALAAERIAVVGQLTGSLALTQADRDATTALRTKADTSFDAALAAAAETQDAGGNREAIQSARTLIAAMRHEVDRLTALPIAERPADSIGPALKPAQQAFEDLSRLLIRIESGPTLNASSIQDNIDLARFAYGLRQWAAERGTLLIGAIASNKPMTPATLEGLAAASGHIGEIWDQVTTMQDTRQLAPAIQAAIATIKQRYFTDNGALYARTIAAGRTDAAYPKLADFRRDHAAGAASPFALRDAAINQALRAAGEQQTDARRTFRVATALLLSVVLVIAGATWFFTRRVVRPIAILTGSITALAARDRAITIPFRSRRDELGHMAKALEQLRQDALAFEALTNEAAAQQAVRQRRAERVGELCQEFQQQTQSTIEAALQSAAMMRDGAQVSSGMITEVEKRAVSVAATTSQAATEMQAIVTSAAHLEQSIDGLTEQVGNSAAIAAQAESAVQQAGRRMAELATATTTIGAVTTLIQQVAAKTNLLALNATIEAARAGEAGKGFAVVAGEVKALATQTASATDDITNQITLVQAATTGVASMVDEISRTIAEITRLSQAVAQAVDQQKKATAEIGSYVTDAAAGIQTVTTDIQGVQGAATKTGTAANAMRQCVTRLTNDAENLTAQIATFLGRVKEA